MTPVIFKLEHGPHARGAFAVFPTLPGTMNPDTMTCYAHIGQHGSCCSQYVREAKPAKPADYADLIKELKSIGYDDLLICRRMTRKHYEQRLANLKRLTA